MARLGWTTHFTRPELPRLVLPLPFVAAVGVGVGVVGEVDEGVSGEEGGGGEVVVAGSEVGESGVAVAVFAGVEERGGGG
jgi:hypothetical protein